MVHPKSASAAKTFTVSEWAVIPGGKREKLRKGGFLRGRRVGPDRKVGGAAQVLDSTGTKGGKLNE